MNFSENFPQNFFQIFGLPPSYEIDFAELEAAYERLSLEHHPDLFAVAGEEEQARSQRISARVNEGYRVLNSDGRRSAYLLGLLSKDRELDATRLPEGFLQEMFQLQEELDDLEKTDDAQSRAKLKEQVEQRVAGVLTERKALFAQGEAEPSAKVLQEIQTNLNCEKYLHRLLERLV